VTLVSYLVTLADRYTGEHQQIIVRSECPHGMQAYIDQEVRDKSTAIRLDSPIVIDIDERTARRIPARHYS
jgi:hypothetical protein